MFKVGDRVICNSALGDAGRVFGLGGVVVYISGTRIGVHWSRGIKGHTCGRRCPSPYGWYVNDRDLRKVATFKGNK